jgi:caa(3)-type oxidase subunit IV
MAIAAAKVALILLFFMKLRSSSALVRLASLAGLFWLVFMFALTAGDYLTRQ